MRHRERSRAGPTRSRCRYARPQAATGGGTSFNKTSEFFIAATGTTAWRYALALPSPDGSYTARARATDGLGNTTAAGSYATSTFKIDTQPPPAPAITAKPSNPTSAPAASFSFTDTEAGVTFLCKIDSGAFVACSSPKNYSGLADGTHTFAVVARDAAGNLSSPASWTWKVDTTAPPVPQITQNPGPTTSAYTVTFAFTDTEAGVSFECKLGSGAWTACSSPTIYYGLSQGSHTFSVRAVDGVGNRSGAASYVFTVNVQPAGAPFTISGNATGSLLPGAAAVPVAAKLTNPGSTAIVVNGLAVTVAQASLPAGCNSAWFAIVQSNAANGNAVTVPANSSVTLPDQGVSAPTIRLIESNTNQDACKNAHPTLNYTGSAHS